jgi:hypothetical protein
VERLAGVRIERGAAGVRLVPPPARAWLAAVCMVALLAGAAWLTATTENGVAAFMAVDFVLWCWVASTARWLPVRRLEHALDIRAAAGVHRGGAREVLVDGRPVTGRIHGAAIAQAHSRSGPPALVVFFVAEGAVVHLATTRDRDEALRLARLVRAELGVPGEPPVHAETPVGSMVGCAGLLVMGLVLFVAYLALAFATDELPAHRAEIAAAGAALHGVLAVALRRGLEVVGAGATRRAARRIFGVEA